VDETFVGIDSGRFPSIFDVKSLPQSEGLLPIFWVRQVRVLAECNHQDLGHDSFNSFIKPKLLKSLVFYMLTGSFEDRNGSLSPGSTTYTRLPGGRLQTRDPVGNPADEAVRAELMAHERGERATLSSGRVFFGRGSQTLPKMLVA
jgi:hypothetical protein